MFKAVNLLLLLFLYDCFIHHHHHRRWFIPSCISGDGSQLGKPWVLNPAAVSCSSFRLKACLELVDLKPTVIKGNGSEIISLSSASQGQTKGADSSHESTEAIEAAKSLALSSAAVVAVLGAVDIVTDVKRVIVVHNGTKMMQKITATGYSLAGLIAAFLAVDPLQQLEATVSAMSV